MKKEEMHSTAAPPTAPPFEGTRLCSEVEAKQLCMKSLAISPPN